MKDNQDLLTLRSENKKLKKIAKSNEETRLELVKTAKEKEKTRIELAKTVKELNKVAKEKNEIRVELAKNAEIIKELSDRNEAILSSIGDAAFACNNQGVINLFNKMAEEVTGIPKKKAIGRHFNDVVVFVNELTGKPTSDFIFKAIKQKKKTTMAGHTALLRKDGGRVPVADSAAPIFNTKGKVIGCVVVFRDVTKEKSVDRAKTEMISLASHQLRTPLTVIGWSLELLQSEDNGVLSDQQKKIIGDIVNAQKRMALLINSLLNVARLDLQTFIVDPVLIDIEHHVKVTTLLFKQQIEEKKLTFVESFADNLTKFNADPNILGIILQNLISNAVKYTHEGGKIELKIKKNKSLEISVSDSGIGIPKDQQAKIFTKLFRADNADETDSKGTGLGLYLVYQIVNASGGKVWFESKEGKGSTFHVSYPLKGMKLVEGKKNLEAMPVKKSLDIEQN